MDRYAVFVDAGYFFAAGAQAAFGKQTPRKQISLKSAGAMLEDLSVRSSAVADNLPLLRIYWYDAPPGARPSLEQSTLAVQKGIKLRFGALNSAGEQKGVDSLIVTDLIDLARNRAITDAVVVSGDEDLQIAFQIAQSFGVRVHILAAGDPAKNVHHLLQMEADSLSALDASWFLKHLDLAVPAQKPLAASTTTSIPKTSNTVADATLESAAETVINEIAGSFSQEQRTLLAQHFTTQQTVPPEYDRPLIAKVSAALSSRRLTGAESRHIRGLFVRKVKSLTGNA